LGGFELIGDSSSPSNPQLLVPKKEVLRTLLR